MMILLCLVMIGCSKPYGTIENVEGEEHALVDLPSLSAVIDGETYELATGNYRMERREGASTSVIQTDALSPHQIAEQVEPISVKANMTIEFVTDGKPDMTVFEWDKEERIDEFPLQKNQLQIPTASGRYIYEVIAEWRNAEVSYTLVMEVD